MKRSERIGIFVEEIWKWYSVHKRELPWRDLQISDENERAYRVLVSEIMLQQTQVERVKIVFRNFLEQFPKMEDLARATNGEVILAWRGMGYNSRALRLRDAARVIHEEGGGIFPRDMAELLAIKGIGNYTAAAIRNFAFNIPTPCLDTNIRRILHRVFFGPEFSDSTWPKDDRELLKIADECLRVAVEPSPPTPLPGGEGSNSRDARNWHAALMDYGSMICTKRSPKWELCPLTRKGIMKAAGKPLPPNPHSIIRKEPGRLVGSTYIPNRIFRGKIVEELRDAPKGLTLPEIGARICVDWSQEEHYEWLRTLIEKLTRDSLVREMKEKILLVE